MFTFAPEIVKPNFGFMTLAVAANAGFPAHELGDILRHVRLHRNALLAAWHEHFGN
jgi:Domain of unknown function (DUF4160)